MHGSALSVLINWNGENKIIAIELKNNIFTEADSYLLGDTEFA